MAPQGAVLLFSYNKTKGFEQGGSEAEENAPGEHFRRRGNELSEAIGAGAPGQNPFGQHTKTLLQFTAVAFSFKVTVQKAIPRRPFRYRICPSSYDLWSYILYT